MQVVNKYYTPAIKEQKRCLYCDTAFVGIQRKNFCNKKCRHKYHHAKDKAVERTFNCAYCHTPFTATHTRKYCAPLCSTRASKRKINVGPHTKYCQVCNKPFMANGKGQKNCSDECYKQAEKARYIRTRHHINISKVEKVDRFRVFEAHNWHCALCGIHTPKELRGTFQPNEPTLDHIIPLSKGGSHTYDNVQLLCRRCNCAVKKDRTETEGAIRSPGKRISETVGLPTFSPGVISMTGGAN